MEWTSGFLKISETSSGEVSDMRYKPFYVKTAISSCNFFRYLSELVYLKAIVYSIFML